MIEENHRQYIDLQKSANAKRQKIKDFDKKQEEKKVKEFDVSCDETRELSM